MARVRRRAGSRNSTIVDADRAIKLKEILNEELFKERKKLRDITDSIRSVGEDRFGVGDIVDEISASIDEVTLLLVRYRSEKLDQIQEALYRLNVGTYGICPKCDGEISLKRILALPFAVLCKDCQESRDSNKTKKHRHVSFPSDPTFIQV